MDTKNYNQNNQKKVTLRKYYHNSRYVAEGLLHVEVYNRQDLVFPVGVLARQMLIPTNRPIIGEK